MLVGHTRTFLLEILSSFTFICYLEVTIKHINQLNHNNLLLSLVLVKFSTGYSSIAISFLNDKI